MLTRPAGEDAYPHLAPELRRLEGDALAFWGEPAPRHRALEDLVDAWQAGGPELDKAIERVDAAIVQGLAALALPRGPLLRPVHLVATTLYEPAGQKLPDCQLLLSGTRLAHTLHTLGQPDDSVRTWVHESLHARQPYAGDASGEYRPFRGYEEGLAEGLARLIVRDRAGMRPLESSYAYYVGAYRALADALGVDVERLWRALWRSPTGRVRQDFAEAVSVLSGAVLTPAQRSRLGAVADTVFASGRITQTPDRAALARTWSAALR